MSAPEQPPHKNITDMEDLTSRLHMTLCFYDDHPDYLVPYSLLQTMLMFVMQQLRKRDALENPHFHKHHRVC